MVFKVADLFDHAPEAAPQTNTGLDVNPRAVQHARSHLAARRPRAILITHPSVEPPLPGILAPQGMSEPGALKA